MRFRKLLAALFLSLASVASADQALVVGVNSYPGLPARYQLYGCINDARLMTSLLQGQGFTVVTLEDVGKERILKELASMSTRVGPGENFVFYFSGHGTPARTLCTSETTEDSGSGDISATELRQGVSRVPAKSRTVLLDACYSGGMGIGKGNRRSRGVPFSRGRDMRTTISEVSDMDSSGPTETCYFAAASEKEEAIEQDVEGQPHGVFTYSLNKCLQREKLWGKVEGEVRGSVTALLTDAIQTPTLSKGFNNVPVYGSKGGGGTVKDDDPMGPGYGTFDPSILSLVSTGSNFLKLGDRFKLSATAYSAGYLVVLNKDAIGKINVLYPFSGQAPIPILVGQVIPLPRSGNSYAADQTGTETVRAFLVPDEVTANKILSWARGGSSKSLVEVPDVTLAEIKLTITP